MKLFSMLALAAVFSCSQSPVHKQKGIKLTILHTNDHHGRFWQNKDGEYGMAARATLIKQLREEIKKDGGEVILLDAGDVNTGVPHSDLLNAEPDFKGMAALNYDAMAIGNHEFDNPLAVLKKQQTEWAKFPFISANIYDQNNKRVFPSHITKKVNGLNVVIFGLTTEDTPIKSTPTNSKGLTFRPVVEEAKELVPVLRKEADVLIAVTHIGHYPDEKHGADAPGDVSVARNATGINLIVGGHTQKPLFEPDIQNGTIIVQAYEWGKYVGRVDLEVVGKEVRLISSKLIPVNLKGSTEKIQNDESMEALLRPYKLKADKFVSKKIGRAEVDFIGSRDVVRHHETNLGNMIAEAYKQRLGTDIAVLNSGGIRDSMPKGDISIETVMTVLPFAGEVVKSKLTGAELKNYLDFVITKQNPGCGCFPQMAGIQIEMDKISSVIRSIKINGKDLDPASTYTMALPEFVATGGDNFPKLTYQKFGLVDSIIVKDFILKKKVLKPQDFAPKGYIKKI